MTDRRVAEAKALAAAGHCSGAYYVLGYAVEHAIKAILAGQILAYTVPGRTFIENFHKHELAELAAHAGLKTSLKERSESDPFFATNWNIVRTWKVEARYRDVPDIDYANFERAELDQNHGVLPWIKTLW